MSTFIIAEAGVNHNGDVALAKQLIDVAAEAGADAVKFQTFRADALVSQSAPKAEYQKRTTGQSESQFEMIRKLELPQEAYEQLLAYARSRNIVFLSTPFDIPSLQLLTGRLGLETIKLASGEITNAPFLLATARAATRVILSTGMSTLADVEAALGVLAFGFAAPREAVPATGDFERALASDAGQRLLRDRVTLLHCTTEYPAPFADVNLRAMGTMAAKFGLPVGYSDHTSGIHISVAAVALGAQIIEKHFTLDRNLPGPDHKASLEPGELRELVRQIRDVERSLGDGHKQPTESEWKNREVARRSVVAIKAIARGERFTPENVGCKRPATGTSPFNYWKILGQSATRDYSADDVLDD